MSRLRLLTADPKTLQADQLVAEARQALAAGRRQAARRWLWGALAADPENVHAWLMLATLSSPEASLAYVSRALELRPHNPVAQRALEWAQRRLEQEARPKAEAPSGAAAVTLLRIPAVEKAEEELLPLEAAAAETLLHAPDLDATVAQVELEGEASAPEAGAVTLLHTPALEEARPEAAAAETLLHAPDLEGTIAEVALAEQAAEPNLASEKPPPPEAAAETLLHAPDLEGTIAEVELEGEGAEPGAAAEAPGQAPPQPLEVTVAEVDLPSLRVEKPPAGKAAADEDAEVEGTAPHRAVSGEEEDVSSTSPHKAVRPDGPAGRAARTLIGIVAIALIGLAAVTVGGRLAGPARPAAIAAAPLEHFQKSTDAPFPTDTPTVTPSPTITPTFTPTPSITPTPPASPTPAPFEAWAGGGQARWIDVNLSRQMLTAMQGETPVQSFLVSTGLWNTPTVTGDYHIYVKYPAADMSGPGYYLPLVPYVMYFHKDYGIHGTYWHNNFGNPMSHGCVNMRTDQAGWLFDWASVGTLVHVHY